jgi:molecular chaperone GrpE
MKKNTNNREELNQEMDINTDENQSGTSHLNEPVTEESEVEKLRSELEETKDKFMRKVAEFDNYKRRTAKEKVEMMQTAGKEVIIDLLDILDDTERAQKQMETSDDLQSVNEGMVLVFNKLRTILQSKGLRAMETIGQEFNPDLHDAITEIPAPTPDLKDKVVDEVMKGYYLGDKIIRHAKVVVGK